MTRLDANRKIAILLNKLIEQHPDLRFSQLLQNAGVVSNRDMDEDYPEACTGFKSYWENEFDLESDKVLERIEATCKRFQLLS